MKLTFLSTSPEKTEEIGRRLAASLDASDRRTALVAMRGEMGVGKTAFTRGFAAHFGIKSVKSPTYTIVNEYRGRVRIFHFDLYRIEGEEDLYSTGYEDYVNSDGYCIAEWSENAEELLPPDSIFVTISRTDGEDGRKIEISGEELSI